MISLNWLYKQRSEVNGNMKRWEQARDITT